MDVGGRGHIVVHHHHSVGSGDWGATNAHVMGSDAVGLTTYTFGSSDLVNADQWPGSPPREQHRPRVLPDATNISIRKTPSLARALVSVESFTFDGRAAVTAYERSHKDEEGGWIWGNSLLMSNEQNWSLGATVRSRKSASS